MTPWRRLRRNLDSTTTWRRLRLRQKSSKAASEVQQLREQQARQLARSLHLQAAAQAEKKDSAEPDSAIRLLEKRLGEAEKALELQSSEEDKILQALSSLTAALDAARASDNARQKQVLALTTQLKTVKLELARAEATNKRERERMVQANQELADSATAHARRAAAAKQQFSEGRTALYNAAISGHAEAMGVLLDAGADPNQAEETQGLAPLHAAANDLYLPALRLLLEKGAAVDAKNKAGATPLMGACLGGHVEAARLLLEKGAAVDAQAEDGATALMWACRDGHVEAARLLLEKGADRTLRDKDSDTALEIVELNAPEEAKAELRALFSA